MLLERAREELPRRRDALLPCRRVAADVPAEPRRHEVLHVLPRVVGTCDFLPRLFSDRYRSCEISRIRLFSDAAKNTESEDTSIKSRFFARRVEKGIQADHDCLAEKNTRITEKRQENWIDAWEKREKR